MENVYDIMNLMQPLVDFNIIDSSMYLILITTMYMAVNYSVNKVSRHREANRKRNRYNYACFCWCSLYLHFYPLRAFALEEMKHMNDKHFRKMFRLSRIAFAALLKKLVDEMGDAFEDRVHILRATASSGSHTCNNV